MRILVFLLILANLLFLAWTHNYLGLSPDPESFRVHQQLHPEQLRIVSNDQPPPEVEKPREEAKLADVSQAPLCINLREVPAGEAVSLEKTLSDQFPSFKVTRKIRSVNTTYWIYIPPLKNMRDAENKVGELKQLGIKEYFIVQDGGPNNLAISLGIFSTRESADSAYGKLRDQGVRSAKITERPAKSAAVQLELNGPKAEADPLSAFLKEAAPALKQEACPSGSTGKE